MTHKFKAIVELSPNDVREIETKCSCDGEYTYIYDDVYDDVYLEEEFDEPKKKLPGGEFKKPDPELEPSIEPVSTLDLAKEIYFKPTKEQIEKMFKRVI